MLLTKHEVGWGWTVADWAWEWETANLGPAVSTPRELDQVKASWHPWLAQVCRKEDGKQHSLNYLGAGDIPVTLQGWGQHSPGQEGNTNTSLLRSREAVSQTDCYWFQQRRDLDTSGCCGASVRWGPIRVLQWCITMSHPCSPFLLLLSFSRGDLSLPGNWFQFFEFFFLLYISCN